MSMSSNKSSHIVVSERPDGRLKVQVVIPDGEGRTKGSFRDEVDINNIMRKYRATGQLPALAAGNPKYGEFHDAPTFHEALNIVQKAEQQFSALPADVRRECGNDPTIFLERVQDRAWAEKHKLALPKQPELPKAPEGGTPPAGGGVAGGTPAAK